MTTLNDLTESGIPFLIRGFQGRVVHVIYSRTGQPIEKATFDKVNTGWLAETAFLCYPESEFAEAYRKWAQVYLTPANLARLGIEESDFNKPKRTTVRR